MQSPFSIQARDIVALPMEKANEFVSHILYAEARTAGARISDVVMHSNQSVTDGGIDATVAVPAKFTGRTALLRGGTNGFQIKTGDFKIWQAAVARKELFGKGRVSRNSLKPAINAVFEAGGTYTVLCTGQSFTPNNHQKATLQLISILEKCGFPNPHVNVVTPEQLAQLVNTFYPAIGLHVSAIELGALSRFGSWSRQTDMTDRYQHDDRVDREIDQFQNNIRSASAGRHFHVLASAGSGKTRFVMEVLRTKDLMPFVIYSRNSDVFDHPLISHIRNSPDARAILVVDDCQVGQGESIANHLASPRPGFVLITISNAIDAAPPHGAERIMFSGLSEQIITNVLKSYRIHDTDAERLAHLVEGSPRLAHRLGSHHGQHSCEPFPMSKNELFDRVIAGRLSLTDHKFEDRKKVLSYLAMFKRFGYRGRVKVEFDAIATCIKKHESLSELESARIVKELKDDKILQGENYLYITPRLLHIYAWRFWWEKNPDNQIDYKNLMDAMPESLRLGAFEMFRYAGDESHDTVQYLLGPKGLFRDVSALQDPLIARFFRSLTEANADLALECLERIFDRATDDDLGKLTKTRMDLRLAIEMMLIWRKCFERAAKLLLRLAENENEEWANNSSGVFAAVFTTAWGPVGYTEASPKERFPLLREVLTSSLPSRRKLGYRACEAAYGMRGGLRAVGPEYQGLRPPPQFWTPQKWDEIADYLAEIWRLLVDQRTKVPEDEQHKICQTLVNSTISMGRFEQYEEMVIDSLRLICSSNEASKRLVMASLADHLRYSLTKWSKVRREKWKSFLESLEGDDLHSRIVRWVGIDALADHEKAQANRKSKQEIAWSKLASELVQTQLAWSSEIRWLVSNEAKCAYAFGMQVASIDKNRVMLPQVIDAQREASANATTLFLAGYLRGVSEISRNYYHEILDEIALDSMLARHIADLSMRCSIDDRGVKRLIDCAKRGVFDLAQLRSLGWTANISSIGSATYDLLFDFLIQRKGEVGAATILEIVAARFRPDFKVAKSEVGRVLGVLQFREFIEGGDCVGSSQVDEYEWEQLSIALYDAEPEACIPLAKSVLRKLAETGEYLKLGHDCGKPLLDKVTRGYPIEMWEIIRTYLEEPRSITRFYLVNWLGGRFDEGAGAAQYFPANMLFDWANHSREDRAPLLAEICLKGLGKSDLLRLDARNVLVRYGDLADVQSAIYANLFSESWMGDASAHYERRMQSYKSLLAAEEDQNVKRWLCDTIRTLHNSIMEFKVEEERRRHDFG